MCEFERRDEQSLSFVCGIAFKQYCTKLSMMVLLQLYLKDTLFIALFSNIYLGEIISDNHSVLKFFPTIKTNKYLYNMIELCLSKQLKFIPTIKTLLI